MTADTEFLSGVIEGFYGRPWSHSSRLAYAGYLSRLGLSSFFYCPKSDPYLRKTWQQHWPSSQWVELQELATTYRHNGLQFGVGLSPFELYRSYTTADKKQVQAKLAQLNELEAPLLAVLFDDMPGDVPDLGTRQAEIVADIQAWSTARKIIVCPTYYSFDPVLEKYFGSKPQHYWSQLGEQLSVDVDIFWTGNRVCSDEIRCSDVESIVAALGRPVVLWDNYPVNDGATRSKYLYLEPLAHREAFPGALVSGHFCNPMNQALLSLPALTGLSQYYADQEALSSDDILHAAIGEATLNQLKANASEFQDLGLEEMGDRRRQELVVTYASLPGDGAAEVAAWLRGEYTFDPACLTD